MLLLLMQDITIKYQLQMYKRIIFYFYELRTTYRIKNDIQQILKDKYLSKFVIIITKYNYWL